MSTNNTFAYNSSSETRQMRQANNKLKSELLHLIDQMEAQMIRLQQERADRFYERKEARA